jgi:hypothetical protein
VQQFISNFCHYQRDIQTFDVPNSVISKAKTIDLQSYTYTVMDLLQHGNLGRYTTCK